MRTTIELPDEIMKKAKIKAVQEGISLKELFIKALGKELAGDAPATSGARPWEKLRGMGSSDKLHAQSSGFDDYSGPDWTHSFQVNEPS